jgi:hypothetical protein
MFYYTGVMSHAYWYALFTAELADGVHERVPVAVHLSRRRYNQFTRVRVRVLVFVVDFR